MPGKQLAVKKAVTNAVALPDVAHHSGDLLQKLTSALGVDRDILASDDQIGHAWDELPRVLERIPPPLRDERIVRMSVAVACGLFDASINYVWNATIVELREKVRRFGINIVPQILNEPFDEEKLLDLRDAELLDLCRKLNLIFR